mmetsp:Transcript_9730/g.17766  ORF Transcript_9730/g.17766 Transcript_9730/m.17766 type:complete len:305 (+) Transcript_9730:297-1211(+)
MICVGGTQDHSMGREPNQIAFFQVAQNDDATIFQIGRLVKVAKSAGNLTWLIFTDINFFAKKLFRFGMVPHFCNLSDSNVQSRHIKRRRCRRLLLLLLLFLLGLFACLGIFFGWLFLLRLILLSFGSFLSLLSLGGWSRGLWNFDVGFIAIKEQLRTLSGSVLCCTRDGRNGFLSRQLDAIFMLHAVLNRDQPSVDVGIRCHVIQSSRRLGHDDGQIDIGNRHGRAVDQKRSGFQVRIHLFHEFFHNFSAVLLAFVAGLFRDTHPTAKGRQCHGVMGRSGHGRRVSSQKIVRRSVESIMQAHPT